MPKFDRYLLSQLMVLFGFFSLVLVSVYWVNRAVILFDQLIADGQSATVFLEFTALTLPNVVRLVLPISAFVAAVYVTNRLTSESELVVAQSSGFSAFRLALPVALFGVMVGILMAALVHFLVPISRAQLADRQSEVSNSVTARLLNEGQFIHPAAGITVYLRDITSDGELLDVFLSDARSDKTETIYVAKRAFLVREATGPKLVMFDGQAQTLSRADRKLSTTRFDDFTYDIGSLIPQSTRTWRDLRELSTPQLFVPSAPLSALTGQPASAFVYEAHLRIAQPLTPLITALMGFAALLVGGFSRFGVWRQIVLAVFLLILLHLIDNAMMGEARRNAELWYLVYVPNGLGLLTVAVLLWLADHPALLRRRRRSPAREAT